MQWVLPGQATIQRRSAGNGSSYWDLNEVLNAPMSHFQLGSQLANLQDPTGASPSLDRALLDWIAGLDGAASFSATSAAPATAQRADRVSSIGGAPAPSIISPGATAAASAGHGAQPLPPKRHSTPSPAPLAFVDQRTGFALVLPTTPALSKVPTTLAFQVPQRGVYQAEVKGAIQQPAPTRMIVAYDGPATLSPLIGSTPATAAAHPAPVSVSLRAEVDPIHHVAEATLTEGGRHYHLVSRAGASDRTDALARFETASLAADFRSLHRALSHDVVGVRNEVSFAAEGAQQVSHAGRLKALRRIALDDVQIGDDGVPTFRATYDAERLAPDGSIGRGRYVAIFVEQDGDWRLWFMDPVL
jgi:hypothetical protein